MAILMALLVIGLLKEVVTNRVPSWSRGSGSIVCSGEFDAVPASTSSMVSVWVLLKSWSIYDHQSELRVSM